MTTGSRGVIVAVIDTGIDYNNADLYQNIWINQAEIPNWWYTKSSDGTFDKVVYKSQIVTATPGVITFSDLNHAANQGLVYDSNGDGRIDAGDLLRPLSQGGWDNNGATPRTATRPTPTISSAGISSPTTTIRSTTTDTAPTSPASSAAAGNNGVGVAGVDWNVQIMDLEVFDATGAGSIANIIAAVDYSIQHGAKISNNSWALAGPARTCSTPYRTPGTPDRSSSWRPATAAQSSELPGRVHAAAEQRRIGGRHRPTRANSGRNSNYGASTVTLAAPGVGILSDAPGGGFASYTGTSQAVPFVTGTLALVWGQHPTWTYQQVIDQVTSTVTPLASLKGKTITGGLVNAAAAVGATSPNGGGGSQTPPDPARHDLRLQRPGRPLDQPRRRDLRPAHQRDHVHRGQRALTNPAGQLVSLTALKLPGSDGHQFEIDFNTQAVAGVYTLNIGAGVHGVLGGPSPPTAFRTRLRPQPIRFTSRRRRRSRSSARRPLRSRWLKASSSPPSRCK